MSDRIVVTGGAVVTMNDRGDVHHGGTVVVEGDRIVSVLEAGERAPEAGRVIDATGLAVMPGFVDLHYHTAIERGGYSESLEVEDALFGHWYPMMRALDAETAYWGAMYSYMQAIKSGTVAVNDMFRRVEALAAAAAEIGIRATLSSLVARPEDGLDSLEDNAAAFAAVDGSAEGRVRVLVGLEWLPLATADLLRETHDLAEELGTGIHLHLSESRAEVETSLEKYGGRPTEVAHDFGLLSPRGVAAHCVWLTDGDIALIAGSGVHVSHNPAANSKLGEGLSPVPKLLAAGVNVGLGHDSVEGNNTMSIFDVMRTCAYLQRAVHADPLLMGVPDVLAMATRRGAAALGIDAGVLEPGRKADLILVDAETGFYDPSRPAYRANLRNRLVFASHAGMVCTSIIDGRIVMEDRVMQTVDEDAVAAGARRAVARLIDSLRK